MIVKKMLTTGLVALAVSLPVYAFALSDLVVHNKTDQYSTSKLNGGRCSSETGEVTQPKENPHTISGYKIAAACMGHTSDCVAEIYMTNNCDKSGGQSIAIAHFNALKGTLISNAPGPNTEYKLKVTSNNGLDFTLCKVSEPGC